MRGQTLEEVSIVKKPIRVLQYGMSDTLGGVETFLMNVYRHIDREKVQFDFLLPHTVHDMPFADEAESMGAHIYPVLYSQRESVVKAHNSMHDFFRQHADEYAALHINATIMTHERLAKCAARYGVPKRIFHSHNAIFDESPSLPRKVMEEHARKTVLKYCTDFFACSSLAGRYMFHNDHFRIIPNAIDTGRFQYDESVRDEVRNELHVDNKKVIGFAGRLHEQKNPLFLIDVFNEVHKRRPDTVLVMCGDGPLRGEIAARVELYGLSNSVRMLGVRTDVERIYQAFDVFLFPSRYEGLGIVLVEAQCAGLPCVTTRGRVPDEVNLTGKVAFLALDDSPMKWAEEVIDCFDMPRKDESACVIAKGYEIKRMVNDLTCLYFE